MRDDRGSRVMDTFLILGGSGFLGRHLIDCVLQSGARVVSLSRRAREPQGSDGAVCLPMDVLHRFDELQALIVKVRPTHVVSVIGDRTDRGFDLAFFSYRLAAVLATHGDGARLLLVGSAAEYGVPETVPVTEDHPLRPVSAYGFAKAVQSWAARALYDQCRCPVVVARVFNVMGPGQGRQFLVGSAVAQAIEVLTGERAQVEVGNVDAARDFVDVRDVARALDLLARQGRAGEAYNVCSGRPVVVREILQRIGSLCGLPGDFYCIVPERYRDDIPISVGSPRKITREVGWTPAIGLDCSLSDAIASAWTAHSAVPVGG